MSRQGIMLCYPFEAKRLLKWNAPYIIQPKLNGERCRVLLQDEPLMLSSEENLITSCPHILDELRSLVAKLPQIKGLELDGENYSHGTALQDIHSIVSRKAEGSLHDDHEMISLNLFDLVADAPQGNRLLGLKKLFEVAGELKYLKLVPSSYVSTQEEIDKWLKVYIEAGYEGFVLREASSHYVRKRSVNMMKFKPRKSDVYQIVALQEEVSKDGVPKNSLGAFILRGTDGTIFNVGSGFTQAQRKLFWDSKLIGKWAKVFYQTMSKSNVPCHTVFISVLEQPVTEDDCESTEVPEIWT